MATNTGGRTRIKLSPQDVSIDVVKTTKGYFTGDTGTLLGSNIHSKSVSDTERNYFVDIVQTHTLSSSAESQLSVFYAHSGGSGSNLDGTSSIYGETQALYGQMASYLLPESEVSGGFKISAGDHGLTPTSRNLTTRDVDMYGMVFNRSKFTDRVNTGTLSMVFQGLATLGGSGSTLHLTDDSKHVSPIQTVAGPRVNLVSGSNGTPNITAAVTRYGVLYPDAGIALFSRAELSASIPGPSNTNNITASFSANASHGYFMSSSGFAPNLDTANNAQNHIRLANCLKGVSNGGKLVIRSENDTNRKYYFCRINPGDFNFSNNPTMVSGSRNELRHKTMWGNPVVYATGINLYDNEGVCVATGKLSQPLKKNFGILSVIKAILTF